MGLFNWFPFIGRKGYSPVLLYNTILITITTTGQRRFDVLGTSFRTIREAYSSHPQDIANSMLRKEVERFGNHLNMTLYIDGPQPVEKESTGQVREAARMKALDRLSTSLETFETRMEADLRIRKQHFIAIKKNLASAFYWSLSSRQHFAEYMRGASWTVILCNTEADVAIARDAQPGDIVISSNSDMTAYPSVQTLWRPVSQELVLVYSMPDVLKTIGFSRNQLTALAIVSRNDYQRNIYSLGPASNYSIIKAIGHRPVVQMPSQVGFDTYQELFKDLMQRYSDRKQTRRTISRSPQDNIVRVRKPRSFNRYSTVESPILVSGSSPPPAAPVPQEQETLSATPQQDDGHPPLNRTRIPRNRTRFSFKERTRKTVHDPPPKMKQFVLKHYKESPTTVTNQTSDKKPKANAEKDSITTKKPPGTKGKNGLVRSMVWYHPTVSLETGTLVANTKRVFTPSSAPASSKPATVMPGLIMPTTATLAPSTPFMDRPDLQRLVVECLQEAPQLAAGVKREAQRLVAMKKKMDAAELRVMTELQSTTESMTEADRVRKLFEARRDAISDDERRILDHLCERIKLKEDNGENDGGCGRKDSEDNGDIDDKDGAEQDRFLRSFLVFLYSGSYPKMMGKTAESLTNNTGVIPTVNTFINWLVDRKMYKPPRSRGEIDVRMPYTPSCLVRSVSGQLVLELKKIYGNGTFDLYKKAEPMKKKGTLGATVDIQIREEVSAAENFLHFNKLTNYSRRIAPFTSSQQPFVAFSERKLAPFFWKRELLRERLKELARQDHTLITSTTDLDKWISEKEPGFIIKHFLCDVAPQGLTSRERKKAGHRAAVKLLSLNEIGAHLDVVKDKCLDPSQYQERGYVLRGSIRTDGFRVQLLAFKLRELQDVRYRRLPENRLPPRLTSTVGDAGQACVIGAFAHLPAEFSTNSNGKDPVKDDFTMGGVTVAGQQPEAGAVVQDLTPTATAQESATSAPPISPRPMFFNLAVKSKAVYQPNFRFRRWLKNEKKATPDGENESLQAIETRLPPLKGQMASVVDYVKELELVETRLLEFYSGSEHRYNRHVWDMKRAKHMEFQLIADQLLKIVGGGIGLRYDPSKPVLIGARSLGYVVVGLNEYYTSKKCPGWGLFMSQVDIRRFYCGNCRAYHHRDVMAAENMANIIQEYLVRQERPDYLHPVAEDGSLPWKAKRDGSSSSSTTTTASNAISSTSGVQGRRKRASSTSAPEQDRPQKSSKSSKSSTSSKASKS
ncbi:hypothetical protein BGW39_007435 [Mortierella sp. 14UC]|nr:hypothetical protein BGW39_007435 [Mortierella sp. 14UC]